MPRPKAGPARCGRPYIPTGCDANDRPTDYVLRDRADNQSTGRKLLTQLCRPLLRSGKIDAFAGSSRQRGAADGNQRERIRMVRRQNSSLLLHGVVIRLLRPGQDARHVDLIWPLWNLFDFAPEGRGKD
jgi:hypothetical protein